MKAISKLCLVLSAATGSLSLSASGQGVATPWALPSIYGTNINSTNFASKVVVLNFWATWCGPCIAEIPDLIALQQKYSPDGMTVVGISVDDSPDGMTPPTALVSSFATSQGMNYPIVMSRPLGYAVEAAYGGISGIPTSFIIDRQNNIQQTFVGEQTYGVFEGTVVPLIYANLVINLFISHGLAHISWPMTQATSFVVESTADLSSGVWTMETAPIQSDGTNHFVDLPAGPSQRFFRLQSQ